VKKDNNLMDNPADFIAEICLSASEVHFEIELRVWYKLLPNTQPIYLSLDGQANSRNQKPPDYFQKLHFLIFFFTIKI
jgi:hypothetical protein